MNRQLPADEITEREPAPTFSHVLHGLRWRNSPASPASPVTHPRPTDEDPNEQARRIIAAAQVNDTYRQLTDRKVKATARMLAFALALFLFAVLSPTPQPWALVAFGAVLAGAFSRARRAGSLWRSRRRQVRALLGDVARAAAS